MLSGKEIWAAFGRVIRREMRLMFHQPIYFYSTLIVMMVCTIFFLTLLHRGQPERMPVAVVDMDGSTISRRIVHELNATQSVVVAYRCADFAEARRMMQRGDVYAILVIPENLYNDMLSFKRPTLTFYINATYTMGATVAYKQLMMFGNLASGAFQREVLRKKGLPDSLIMQRIQPIVIEGHMLSNPSSNYSVYLSSVLLPGILGLIVLVITVFSIGMELKWKTSRNLLAEARGSMVIAMVGKMVPHIMVYTTMGISLNILLFRIMGFPMNGSLVWLCVGMFMYILAVQSIAVTIVGLLPVLRDALSISALYGMLSFSLSGFTFPVEGMPGPIQVFSWCFPLRHYFRLYVSEALMGNPTVDSMVFIGCQLLFILPQYLVHKRLKNAFIYQNYPLK